jgi:hypothetical protein
MDAQCPSRAPAARAVVARMAWHSSQLGGDGLPQPAKVDPK